MSRPPDPPGPIPGDFARLAAGASVVGLGDGALLERAASGVEPASGLAFEALVRRHWGLVARVCAGVLGDRHLAEDAAQAVFLVLLRRAGTIGQPDRLAPWLHGVALRTARAARRDAARRARPFRPVLTPHPGRDRHPDEDAPMTAPRDPRPGPADALLARERAQLLHDAIGRLPDRDRAPVILCELEGLSHAEAATRLGCPTATVGVRLMRARRKLRDRLARRGVDLDAALAPALAGAPARPIPPPAVHGLARSASLGARRLAARVLRDSLLLRGQAALLASVVLVGGAVVAAHAGAQGPAPAPQPIPSPPQEPIPVPIPVPVPLPAPDPVGSQAAPKPPRYALGYPVEVGTPTERVVTDFEDYNGHLAPSRSVTIRSSRAGTLVDAQVVEGDRVGKGQALFQVGLRSKLDEIERANAAVRDAEGRWADLKKLISTPNEDPSVRDAESVVNTARDVRRRLERDSSGYLSMERAPFAGMITHRTFDVGEDVNGSGVPLATLIVDDPLQLGFQVDERSYLAIRRTLAGRPGADTLPVRVALADEEDFPHAGRVRFQAAQFDPNNGTCTLHAEVPNPDHALIAGLFARVRLEYGAPHPALFVPKEAVISHQGRTAVMVVDDGNIAHRRPVRRGQVAGDLVEVRGPVDARTRIVLRPDDDSQRDGVQLMQPVAAPPAK